MALVYRNIVKQVGAARAMAVSKQNAEKYGETWYWMPDGQMTANAKGRRGYEQFQALAFNPDGSTEIIEANPRSER